MEVNEGYVETLLSMGFPDEGDIREALRISKNDVSEAISVLVNDTRAPDVPTFGCDPSAADSPAPLEQKSGTEEMQVDEALGFPVSMLLELESRTFTEKWSIPFKRNESLCQCIVASTKLAQEKILESDDNAMRFIERSLPECFHKLLNSSQVNTWMQDVQEGIFDMLNYLIELIAERLAYTPLCYPLLELLALALNPQTEFHKRHKAKKADKAFWRDKLKETLSSEKLYSSSTNLNLHKDPYGHVCHLINKFASLRGFERLRAICASTDVNLNDFSHLLFPFGLCAEQVNTDTFQEYLRAAVERAMQMCSSLGKDDWKRRDLRVFPLLSAIRLIYLRFRDKEVTTCDQLRLNIVLSMLASEHFNSRMNGLKELGCMMATAKDPSAAKKKQSIGFEALLQWIQDKELLSLALGKGHSLDNMQMCDSIKDIVEFIGAKLCVSDITKLWHLANASPTLFPVLAAAAAKLPEETLAHLLQLVQAAWKATKGQCDNWHKLVELVSLANKEKALQILWDMAHDNGIMRLQIDTVMQQHLALLKDYAKDNQRKLYLTKCVADIKGKQLVFASVNYMHQLCCSVSNNGYRNDTKNTLNDWNSSYELVLTLVNSIKDHQKECYQQFGEKLGPDSSTDGNYCHEEFLKLHLDFIHFILSNADLFLTKIRVQELWSSLIVDDNATDVDRDSFFNWLVRSHDDLEEPTRKELFEQHFLKLDTAKVTLTGFNCFKYFFERVNQSSGNLKIHTTYGAERRLTVERDELAGMPFIWQLYLHSGNKEVTDAAMNCLMDCYYRCLNFRFKLQPGDLHRRFLNQCFAHFDKNQSERTVVSNVLHLLQFYIRTAEADFQYKRLRPQHCVTYPGDEVQLDVTCDRPKLQFVLSVQCHMLFGKLRDELAIYLHCEPSKITLSIDAIVLQAKDEWKPLFLIGIQPRGDNADAAITVHASVTETRTAPQDANEVQEKSLPSNILADDARTYPLLKQCLKEQFTEAASVLDLLPTCADDVSIDDVTVGSPLLTYSLQCLFTKHATDIEQFLLTVTNIEPEQLSSEQLYLIAHLVAKSANGISQSLAAYLLRAALCKISAAACVLLLKTLCTIDSDVLLSLPGFQQLLTDLLIGHSCLRVRQSLCQLLQKISDESQVAATQLDAMLQKLPLPFWHQSISSVRGTSQRLLRQCTEYFTLRSQLLTNVTNSVDIANRVLTAELDWLLGYQLGQHSCEQDTLLAGHLLLLKSAWLTGQGSDADVQKLLPLLVHTYLMPQDSPNRAGILARPMIYELLFVLCSSDADNVHTLADSVHDLHKLYGWEVPAPPDPRSQCGLVGLKNGGATCYMNSVLQQLFMVPSLAEEVMSASTEGSDCENVLYQLQLVMAHLTELQQQYYVPDQLWANFSLWGEKVNPREQQDAFAFFQALIDQIDEQSKRQLLSSFFRGRFKYFIESEQCEHKYEIEEDFYGLHLPVQSGNLEAALHQFVKGETMQADNAYACEKCNKKVTALRRTKICHLPPVLCIQLKRFDYDWLRGLPLKSDLHFSFPRSIDLGPFLADDEAKPPPAYRLVGAVIHSGKASAGHYYSLVRERRPGKPDGWFKMNDQVIEPIDLTDETLESECFGGTFQSNESLLPEERKRYWSAYMLFYERANTNNSLPNSSALGSGDEFPMGGSTSGSRHDADAGGGAVGGGSQLRAKGTKRSGNWRSGGQRDSFAELSALVQKGEQRGVFCDLMPAHIAASVRESNLNFYRKTDLLNECHFNFVYKLSECALDKAVECPELIEQVARLLVKFLFDVYLRTEKRLRYSALSNGWDRFLIRVLSASHAANCNFLEFFSSASQLSEHLIVCPVSEQRKLAARAVGDSFGLVVRSGQISLTQLDSAIDSLLRQLPAAASHLSQCAAYFQLLFSFVDEHGLKACSLLYMKDAFGCLVSFLFNNELKALSGPSSRELVPLHRLLCCLPTFCAFCTGQSGGQASTLLRLSDSMLQWFTDRQRAVALFTQLCGCADTQSALRHLVRHSAVGGLEISKHIAEVVLKQLAVSAVNELKPLLDLLLDLFLVNDSMQADRVRLIIDGWHSDTDSNDTVNGLLSIVTSRSDARRTYRCMKLIVEASGLCNHVRDHMLGCVENWTEAVAWLKDKMDQLSVTKVNVSSNETALGARGFQRTISAQVTLQKASALLGDDEAMDTADN